MVKKTLVGPKRRPTGEIVSLKALDVAFGQVGHFSPYDEMLERLLDAPKESVLKISNPGARYSIVKRARIKGLKVSLGQADGCLYVKVDGFNENGTASKRATESEATKHKETALKALRQAGGVATPVELARTMGLPKKLIANILEILRINGQVESDGTVFRVPGPARG